MIYLHLYHGRTDPKADMDDWGTSGPVFGPYDDIQTTYMSTVRCLNSKTGEEFWPGVHEDMIEFKGVYYGDWSVISEEHYREGIGKYWEEAILPKTERRKRKKSQETT